MVVCSTISGRNPRLFIIFWFEKPQRAQRTQRKAAPLCDLCVLCG